MKQVWKYKLGFTVTDDMTISMPAGAELLTVQVQYGAPALWARVDPEARLVKRRIHISGTGHVGAEGRYIGTFQLDEGRLVFHVFDHGAIEEWSP